MDISYKLKDDNDEEITILNYLNNNLYVKSIMDLYKLDNKDEIIYICIENFERNTLNIHLNLNLNYFVNLKSLDLTDLKEIPSLEGLINLQILGIYDSYDLTELPSFDSLINLRELYLSIENLKQLPRLDALINLEVLNVCAYNYNLKELPCLDKCIKLRILDCHCNDLTELPSLDCLVNLEMLDCRENRLTKLPSLKNLTKLKRLHAWLSSVITPSLPRSIIYCSSLYEYKNFNEYKENKNLTSLINFIISENYYYLPIMDYYNNYTLN